MFITTLAADLPLSQRSGAEKLKSLLPAVHRQHFYVLDKFLLGNQTGAADCAEA